MLDYYSSHVFNKLLPRSWFINVVGGNTVGKSGYSSYWGIITNWRPAFIRRLEAEQRAVLTKHNAAQKAKRVAKKHIAQNEQAKQALVNSNKNDSTFFEKIKKYAVNTTLAAIDNAVGVKEFCASFVTDAEFRSECWNETVAAVINSSTNLWMSMRAWYEYKTTMTLEMSIRFSLARQLLRTVEGDTTRDHWAPHLTRWQTAVMVATPVAETIKALVIGVVIVVAEAIKLACGILGILLYVPFVRPNIAEYFKLRIALPLYRIVRQAIHGAISVIDLVKGVFATKVALNIPARYNRDVLEDSGTIMVHGNLVWAMQKFHRAAAAITNVKAAITPAFASFRHSSTSTSRVRDDSDFTVEISAGKPVVSGHLSMSRV